jgi:tetratricopeptide (TPR) repeat protein
MALVLGNKLGHLCIALSVLPGCGNRNQGIMQKETPVIIFRDASGRTLTMEDLRGVTGTFRYEIVGSTNIPPEARLLHEKAREAGAQGDYKKCFELLEKASALAPQWPYPVYDRAYTHLLMKDYDNARRDYQETVRLSPRGFFTAITALDILEKEKNGDLPIGTYLAYLSLEWIRDPGQREKAVRQLVKDLPQFAPGWKELATLVDDKERLSIIEKGLAASPALETKGMLQINKALELNRRGELDGAIRLLGDLALDPNSPFDTEQMAKASIAMIVKR